jgi:hypothetical protein
MSYDGIDTALFGFCMLTVCQVKGGKIPAFALFSISTIMVLTGIAHKEQRFMTAIFPLFIISWAYLWTNIIHMLPFVKKVFKIVFMIYVASEIKMTLKMQLNYSPGDKEIYNLLHDRSSLLLDYPEGRPFERIESFFCTSKYESPLTTWAHVG